MEASTPGNPNNTIHTDDNGDSNIPNLVSEDAIGDHNGRPTPPGGLPTDVTAVDPPESLPDTADIVIGTWNIKSGRTCKLERTLQVLSVVSGNIAFLIEAKLTNGIYTIFSLDNHAFATKAASLAYGGVALVVYRDLPYSQVESALVRGLNVISAEIVSGNKHYGMVGAYIPLGNSTPSVYVQQALDCFATLGRPVILVGDSNITLDFP